ncbi:type II secretion system secretin GspD [Pseudomonas sp. CAU 1711]|uniref:type II secretion system secretin GspD n=1 Tax=Pseudomonas sp. CAU 1711 TaxID=3140356 RepID=UPI0032605E93
MPQHFLLLARAIALTSVVATAAAATPVAANAPSERLAERGGWTLNLRDADIRDFIEQISSIGGQTFIVDPRVKGRVTVMAQQAMTPDEVHQLFLAVMTTHGFAVAAQGNQLSIVPIVDGRTLPGQRGNLETRVLQVQQGSVGELMPMIRPLVANHGHLAAVPSSNSLIISDAPANIERIHGIVEQLDRGSLHDFTLYELRHGWVQEMAEVLAATIKQQQAGGAQVIADTRGNRLLLLGPSAARTRLLQLVQSLDTPSARSANARVIRLRYGDAKQLAETLGELGDGLDKGAEAARPALVRADEGLNAIVILAEPERVDTLESLVRQLDVPRAQVLVEAAIVEISGDVNEALGVQWAIGAHGDSALGGVNFGNTGLSVGTLLGAIANDKQGELASQLPNGAIVGVGSDGFGALITALSSTGKSNLLSTPSLLTLDNQEAEILVGQNVPFQTGSYATSASGAGNPFTTIERKDIGITLKITPHINEDLTLRLVIEQEISSIAPSTQAVDLVTNKRSIKSTVLAENGQVLVLGGLMQDDVTRSESKVPLLGDLPGVGGLFRSTRETRQKRNLMVFLRPSVARDGAGLAGLSEGKYRDLRLLGGPRQRLPEQAQQLFDRQPAEQPPGVPAQAFSAPERAEPEVPILDGRGGEELLPPRAQAPSDEPPRRHTIELIRGSSAEFMRALLQRHPGQPLRLEQRGQGGESEYAILFSSYPSRELALRALTDLPSDLPQRQAKVIAER